MVEQRDYSTGLVSEIIKANCLENFKFDEIFVKGVGTLVPGESYPFPDIASNLEYFGPDSPPNSEGNIILVYFQNHGVNRKYFFLGECNGRSANLPRDLVFLGMRELS